MDLENKNYRMLTPEEEDVIINKGTEMPFSGKYDLFYEDGIYRCKRCGAPLYRSEDKFSSGCGWPSFDDAIKNAVKKLPDADGQRTEIICAHCGAHLGHVFEGEWFTSKNTRHCVNSISLEFAPEKLPDNQNLEIAIFAGGCFWGVEYYLQRIDGVISTEVGYIGGITENPTYEEVCSHATGHAEAVRVIFDSEKIDFESLLKTFFELHDPTQHDGQGPDIGMQYRSEIFYTTPEQKIIAEKVIKELKNIGYDVVTKIIPATTFWKAEDYHQDYYHKKGGVPYCHGYVKRFPEKAERP